MNDIVQTPQSASAQSVDPANQAMAQQQTPALTEVLLSPSENGRSIAIGGEDVRFKLNDIYTSAADPQLMADLAEIERLYVEFDKTFRGKLSTELGAAMEACETIDRLESKLGAYVSLLKACKVDDQELQRLSGQIDERLSKVGGNHFAFFDIEVGKMDDQVYAQLLQTDARVARYAPRLDRIRKQAKHYLSEEVERALALRSPFGPSEWREMFDEREAALRIPMQSDVFKGQEFYGKELSTEEIIDVVNQHPQREVRFAALGLLNKCLEAEIVPLMGRTLNLVAGLKSVEDAERGYPHSMAGRNMSNMVSDEVVHALHNAVCDAGVQLGKRYYKLLAAHLGVDKLYWSDRNAPLKEEKTKIPWNDAVQIVKGAYASFSPTLAALIEKTFANGWVDAPHYSGKESGAFNLSIVMPEPLGPRAYTLMNYLGNPRDVATLAHELGHGVHGLLAGEKQGSLMCHAPIAYCETASIFGEMVTFEYLVSRCSTPEEKLTLLMGKINDFMNTVVRQISFSLFEQALHEARKEGKLTTKSITENWMKVTQDLYGKEGEVFEYHDMQNLWAYISHFMRPFYVYGYAFGELLTQSLFAVKDSYGDTFEPLYIDLLRAGGTKDAVALLAPFGLDPRDPAFWSNGMQASVGKWLDEAEALSKQLGIIQ